ncbi:MAG TPA: tyrosine-type recombinase/integrase [Promineifilum sp.]
MEEQLVAFLSHLEQQYRYSENTVAAYRNDLYQFLAYVKSRWGTELENWSSISENDIEAYLQYMKDKDHPYASSTIARKVAAIKSFYNYLSTQGMVDKNPTLEIDSPKVKKRLPRTLNPDEVDRLLRAPGDDRSPKTLRDRSLLNVLYETGMRVTEVVSIQLNDLSPDRKTLSSPTRQGEGREIPLEESTQALLASYLAEGRPMLAKNDREQALFLNHRGEKLTRQGLWLIIKGYARQAGLKTQVTPHTLRHSFAVHRLGQGSSLEDVQALLGHANLSTTQIYAQMESVDGEKSSSTQSN